MSTINLTRRGFIGASAALASMAVITACSDTPTPTAKPSASASTNAYATTVNSGPVADAKTISANKWASAVKAAGKLRVGGTKTNQVFSLEDVATGKVTGFDAGLSQLLAHYILGGDDAQSLVALTQVTSDTRETLLSNGDVDAVFATYTITPERAQKISFAGPYYQSGQAVLVKSDNAKITSVKDLKAGVKVAVQSNSTSIKALDTYAPEAEKVQFEDDAACVAAVEQGQVDAYVLDQAILLSTVANDKNVKIVGEPFTTDPYGIGLPKDSDAQAFVDTFLQKIYDGGQWEALWKATIGAITGGSTPTPPKIGSVPGSEIAGASAQPSAS